MNNWGFPGGTVVKYLPANTGDIRDEGSIRGLGRSPGIGNGNPLQYSCLENSMDRKAWWASPRGSHIFRPDWADTHIHTYIHWRPQQTILQVCTCYEKLKMRKTVYLSKYSPHLLLFLHFQSFKLLSGVIVLSAKYSHIKRSSKKNAESKRKQWASLSCCWDHTSSGQRRVPLPEALGSCLAATATAASGLPRGRGGRGEKPQTGVSPSLPDPHSPSCPIRGPEIERVSGSSVCVVCGSRPGDARGQ